MSKIVRHIKCFREMSILAEDEQRRSDHPKIDVEHLFLALVSIGVRSPMLWQTAASLSQRRERRSNTSTRTAS